MPKKVRRSVGQTPYAYSSTVGYFQTKELNRRLQKEEYEAARKSDAERRRAAEEKVARENSKRKNEMS